MAQMKIGDIRAMSPDQMEDSILNLKKERFNLRFQRATGQLENTSRMREARRDIASAWSRTRPVSQPVVMATPKNTRKVKTSLGWPMVIDSRGSRKKKL